MNKIESILSRGSQFGDGGQSHINKQSGKNKIESILSRGSQFGDGGQSHINKQSGKSVIQSHTGSV